MHVLPTLIALSVATVASACASPETTNATPPSTGMARRTMGVSGPMAVKDPGMKTTHEMQLKMASAT